MSLAAGGGEGGADRDLVDRLQASAPGLAGLYLAGIRRTRPGSDVRRRFINWSVKRGFRAMNRSDVDLVVMIYEPEAEIRMRGMGGVGIRDRYLGNGGIRELYADLDEAYRDWSYAIREVIDLVDQVAVRADFLGYGRRSGAETRLSDVGTLVKFSARGKASRQYWFVESGGWRDTLEAAGLSE